jgi:hypothetical protein
VGPWKSGGADAVPRYVVLEHDHPVLHWDLMLEAGKVLRTWRLAAPPEARAVVAAEPSFDHRLAYLDYEGPVSGDRGQVRAWDRGTFAWLHREETGIAVRLEGVRLRGILVLEPAGEQEWQARYEEVTPPGA